MHLSGDDASGLLPDRHLLARTASRNQGGQAQLDMPSMCCMMVSRAPGHTIARTQDFLYHAQRAR